MSKSWNDMSLRESSTTTNYSVQENSSNTSSDDPLTRWTSFELSEDVPATRLRGAIETCYNCGTNLAILSTWQGHSQCENCSHVQSIESFPCNLSDQEIEDLTLGVLDCQKKPTQLTTSIQFASLQGFSSCSFMSELAQWIESLSLPSGRSVRYYLQDLSAYGFDSLYALKFATEIDLNRCGFHDRMDQMIILQRAQGLSMFPYHQLDSSTITRFFLSIGIPESDALKYSDLLLRRGCETFYDLQCFHLQDPIFNYFKEGHRRLVKHILRDSEEYLKSRFSSQENRTSASLVMSTKPLVSASSGMSNAPERSPEPREINHIKSILSYTSTDSSTSVPVSTAVSSTMSNFDTISETNLSTSSNDYQPLPETSRLKPLRFSKKREYKNRVYGSSRVSKKDKLGTAWSEDLLNLLFEAINTPDPNPCRRGKKIYWNVLASGRTNTTPQQIIDSKYEPLRQFTAAQLRTAYTSSYGEPRSYQAAAEWSTNDLRLLEEAINDPSCKAGSKIRWEIIAAGQTQNPVYYPLSKFTGAQLRACYRSNFGDKKRRKLNSQNKDSRNRAVPYPSETGKTLTLNSNDGVVTLGNSSTANTGSFYSLLSSTTTSSNACDGNSMTSNESTIPLTSAQLSDISNSQTFSTTMREVVSVDPLVGMHLHVKGSQSDHSDDRIMSLLGDVPRNLKNPHAYDVATLSTFPANSYYATMVWSSWLKSWVEEKLQDESVWNLWKSKGLIDLCALNVSGNSSNYVRVMWEGEFNGIANRNNIDHALELIESEIYNAYGVETIKIGLLRREKESNKCLAWVITERSIIDELDEDFHLNIRVTTYFRDLEDKISDPKDKCAEEIQLMSGEDKNVSKKSIFASAFQNVLPKENNQALSPRKDIYNDGFTYKDLPWYVSFHDIGIAEASKFQKSPDDQISFLEQLEVIDSKNYVRRLFEISGFTSFKFRALMLVFVGAEIYLLFAFGGMEHITNIILLLISVSAAACIFHDNSFSQSFCHELSPSQFLTITSCFLKICGIRNRIMQLKDEALEKKLEKIKDGALIVSFAVAFLLNLFYLLGIIPSLLSALVVDDIVLSILLLSTLMFKMQCTARFGTIVYLFALSFNLWRLEIDLINQDIKSWSFNNLGAMIGRVRSLLESIKNECTVAAREIGYLIGFTIAHFSVFFIAFSEHLMGINDGSLPLWTFIMMVPMVLILVGFSAYGILNDKLEDMNEVLLTRKLMSHSKRTPQISRIKGNRENDKIERDRFDAGYIPPPPERDVLDDIRSIQKKVAHFLGVVITQDEVFSMWNKFVLFLVLLGPYVLLLTSKVTWSYMHLRNEGTDDSCALGNLST